MNDDEKTNQNDKENYAEELKKKIKQRKKKCNSKTLAFSTKKRVILKTPR